jgi:hypothetical protein
MENRRQKIRKEERAAHHSKLRWATPISSQQQTEAKGQREAEGREEPRGEKPKGEKPKGEKPRGERSRGERGAEGREEPRGRKA